MEVNVKRVSLLLCISPLKDLLERDRCAKEKRAASGGKDPPSEYRMREGRRDTLSLNITP